jgi:hypothetical protein
MSGAWVAGVIRARALLGRQLGPAGARALAGRESLADALRELCAGPYGHDIRVDDTLADAEHAVGAVLLWHLRVLAGWQPARGAGLVRLLSGWFEIANLVEHARELAGTEPGAHYTLGALGTVWPRLATTRSLPELREGIAASVWGDPGESTPGAIAVGLQIGWATRIVSGVPQTRSLAAGAVALLAAKHRWLVDRRLAERSVARVRALLGVTPDDFGTLAEFADALPDTARWALTDTAEPEELWRAESRWWARLAEDGLSLSRANRFGPDPVIGSVLLLAADAWRTRAALEIAANGGHPLEVFDAVT